MERVLIRGGTVITMTGPEAVYPDGVVAVEDGVIRYAGPRSGAPSEVLAPGWAGREIDATGRLVLPGLVNTHTHAAMVLLRGYADDMRLMEWLQTKIWPVEAALTPEDIYWGTALAAAESLLAGVTTFNDMYIFEEEAARAVEALGIRAVLCRGIIGSGPDFQSRVEEARALLERWHGGAGGRITTLLAPHAPYTVPPAELETIAGLAADWGVGIHIHLAETRDEIEILRKQYGKSPFEIAHEAGLTRHLVVAAHCVHATDRDIELFAQAPGGGVAHCPVSNLKLACGVAPILKWKAAGVSVGLGTDGAASANQLSLWGEMRLMALLQKNASGDPAAFTAYDAVYAATAGGAAVLGLQDRIGTLEPGKRADIILVNTSRPSLTPVHDPFSTLAYSTNPGDVETVLVDGRVVVEEGRLVTGDLAEIVAKAREQARALLARAAAARG
ncbi:MAG: amidohydrolase [Firmicutes bacterium]|nr:amidohydrolase [Bacillota bacterium]